MKRTNYFKYERKRLGYKTVSPNGTEYGPYLYRNLETGQLLASWDKPDKGKDYLYDAGSVGLYADALYYYKNE